MWCAESRPVTVEMFDTPEKPYALVPGNTSLQLDWEAPSNVNLIRFWFELQKVDHTVHFNANSSFMLQNKLEALLHISRAFSCINQQYI